MTYALPSRATTLSALLLLAITGCSGDDSPTSLDEIPDDLVATWFATSLVIDGTDLVADGMRMRISFHGDGTYEAIATRDVAEFLCEGEWDCTDVGIFTATASEVVFDPDDPFETTLAATLTGTDLRLTGTLDDGSSADLRFVMPPIPELIGTWTSNALSGPSGPIAYDSIETTLAVSFEPDGTYTYASTASDPDDFCDPKVSCVESGAYVVDADAGEITFDPGTADSDVMQIFADEASLVLSSPSEGLELSFQRLDVPTPGEQGSWYAISILRDGVETADPYGWNSQTLRLDGFSYALQSFHADPADGFMCVPGTGAPECGLAGSYTADLDGIDLVDGLAVSLSMETTPLTLRLTGTIDGVAADIVYVRIPSCSYWGC